MLVVISDLHLADGTVAASDSRVAAELFAERLREMAAAAGWRRDGRYRPIDRVDLLLLGDTLDLIRSQRWLERDGVRPWSNARAHDFAEVTAQVLAGVLAQNEATLSIFRQLAADGGLVVPPADHRGRAVHTRVEHPVSLRIHYLVGDRDWPLHLAGGAYDVSRRTLIRAMGLANRHDRPFAHDAVEDDDLLDVLRRHRVAARHGDLFDVNHFSGDREQASLSDALTVELALPFATTIERELADDLPPAASAALGWVDRVHPAAWLGDWIETTMARTCAQPSVRGQVRRMWRQAVDRWLALDLGHLGGAVPALAASLAIGRAPRSSAAVTPWSLAEHALAEPDFRNRRARHVVYAHTHQAETVALEASHAEGHTLEQLYFNTGAWQRVWRPTRLAASGQELVASDVVNFLAIYTADERGGRSYESWSGTLACEPVDLSVHRLDSAGDPRSAAQPLPAAGLRPLAPHFANRVHRTGLVPTRRVR